MPEWGLRACPPPSHISPHPIRTLYHVVDAVRVDFHGGEHEEAAGAQALDQELGPLLCLTAAATATAVPPRLLRLILPYRPP